MLTFFSFARPANPPANDTQLQDGGSEALPTTASAASSSRALADRPDEMELKDIEHTDIEADLENPAELTEVEMEARLNKDYMLTPCGHSYHSVCLKKWIDIRRECPTCRAAIPLPEDHDEL